MTGQGRPIRFLALVALGWVAVRIALRWAEAGSLPEALRQALPLAPRVVPDAAAAAPQVHPRPAMHVAPIPAIGRESPPLLRAAVAMPTAEPRHARMAPLALIQPGAAATPEAAPLAMPLAVPVAAQPDHLPPAAARWSASAWLVARAGAALGVAPGASQIGGGQAGLRVAYMLLPERRVAAFARAVTPFKGKGAEATIGLEWQPMRAPVRVVAEQRFGLDGTRGGPGIGVIAGFDGPIAPRFRLESYGQAGAIRRNRTEPYADGALRATRTLAEGRGVQLALGGGVWGAAQRDAARFDLGPSATLAIAFGRQNVRFALDWRQRVAGDARPGSGLALTLGSDF